MRKRLRKKKHMGEFAEWGVPIAIRRNRKEDFDRFLDEFIVQAVEGNDCYFGGGGSEDRLAGVIELGEKTNSPEDRIKKVIGWIEAREDIEKYAVGKLTDLWYGPFDEIDSIGEQI